MFSKIYIFLILKKNDKSSNNFMNIKLYKTPPGHKEYKVKNVLINLLLQYIRKICEKVRTPRKG